MSTRDLRPLASAPTSSFPPRQALSSASTIPPHIQQRFQQQQQQQQRSKPPRTHRLIAPAPARNPFRNTADPVLIDNILGLPSAQQAHTAAAATTGMADTGRADEAWAAWAPQEHLEKVVVDLSPPAPAVRPRRVVKRLALAEKVCPKFAVVAGGGGVLTARQTVNGGLRVREVNVYVKRSGAGKA